jgi:hypothetical protein
MQHERTDGPERRLAPQPPFIVAYVLEERRQRLLRRAEVAEPPVSVTPRQYREIQEWLDARLGWSQCIEGGQPPADVLFGIKITVREGGNL